MDKVITHEWGVYSIRQVRSENEEDGPLWLMAKDVCLALGDSNTYNAVRRLEASLKEHGFSEKAVKKACVDIPYGSGGASRKRTVYLVNEAGMLLLCMRAENKRALSFRLWLAEKLLPLLRRTIPYGDDEAVEFLDNEGVRGQITGLIVQCVRYRETLE